MTTWENTEMSMKARYTNIEGKIAADSRNGSQRSYVPDALGSTAMLIHAGPGAPDSFTYWPFGELAQHIGSSFTPFGFVGTLGYRRSAAGSSLREGANLRGL